MPIRCNEVIACALLAFDEATLDLATEALAFAGGAAGDSSTSSPSRSSWSSSWSWSFGSVIGGTVGGAPAKFNLDPDPTPANRSTLAPRNGHDHPCHRPIGAFGTPRLLRSFIS